MPELSRKVNSQDIAQQTRTAYRRRLRYVDSSVQKSLILAMVAFEIILVAVASGFLYWRLSGLIEEQLYRVHLVQTSSILKQVANDGLVVLAVFALINVLTLLAIVKIWSHQENRILQDFITLIRKTQALDFSPDVAIHPRHEVLALAMVWRMRERERLSEFREIAANLESDLFDQAACDSWNAKIDRLREILR
jgi:hypothetical protein